MGYRSDQVRVSLDMGTKTGLGHCFIENLAGSCSKLVADLIRVSEGPSKDFG